jgi:hypothetical protein
MRWPWQLDGPRPNRCWRPEHYHRPQAHPSSAWRQDTYWKIFHSEDLTTPPSPPRLAELIDHRITEMADGYAATYPAAMKCLLADREELTACLRFFAEHQHRVRQSNFIERHLR